MDFAELLNKWPLLLEAPYYYFVIGLVIVLLTLWLVYRWKRNHRGIVPFKTQGGRIEIAPQTIRGILQYAATSVDGVEKAYCFHRQKGSKLHVTVNIQILATAKLKELDSEIKKRIRSVMLSQFGMENIDPIHIKVTKITGQPMAIDYRSSDPVGEISADPQILEDSPQTRSRFDRGNQ